MPQIPQYISERKATTEVSVGLQNPNVAAESGAGVKLQEAAEVISQLGEKMRRIGNANAESDANIAVKQFQAVDIDKRSKLPTKDALKNIENDVRKNREETANQTFSDPIGKAEWLRKQELLDTSYIIDQKADVYKRQVSERKINTLRDLELIKSDYINAQTEEERQTAISQMEAIANNPANEDIYNAEQRKELIDSTIKSAQTDLKDVESLRRVKEKELKVATEKAVNEREKELINMKVKGSDNVGTLIIREDLIRMARDESGKTISPEFAQSFINANKSPKAIKAKTIDKDFANVIAEINMGKMKPQAIMTAMLDLVSYGNLSEEDFASASAYLNIMTDKNVSDLVTSGKRSAWESLRNFAGSNNTAEAESRARMSRAFINKLQSGIEAPVAALEATREEVLYLRPEARNYSEGMIFIDNDGRTKKIMPNGDLLNIETKPKSK